MSLICVVFGIFADGSAAELASEPASELAEPGSNDGAWRLSLSVGDADSMSGMAARDWPIDSRRAFWRSVAS